MKPTIVQRSHSQLLQVLKAQEHVATTWEPEDWHRVNGWDILRLFRSQELEKAIRFAKQCGGFFPETLQYTLGSWDAKRFAPNPPPDETALATYRQNLREYANAVRPEKRQRDKGKKARRARRAILDNEEPGVTTVHSSRL
jgi:hypothetical protein